VLQALVERALNFHTLSISDLVAVFEDTRPDSMAQRREVMSLLRQRRHGVVIGVTGTPGSGKSTLLGRLAVAVAEQRVGASVAVLAVDPSSPVSGGALLGDRVRVRFPIDRPELYFRSQASDAALGGLGPRSFQVTRLLLCLFDYVFVETVGIGQSEIDVRWLCDRMLLVLQPLAGDEVQLLKAGVMEVPDVIVVNKCDEKAAARKLVAALSSSLPMSRPFGDGPPPVFQTSALNGDGIDALCADVLSHAISQSLDAKESHFFRRWVKDQWGMAGAEALTRYGTDFVAAAGGLDEAQHRLTSALGPALAAAFVAAFGVGSAS